MEDEQILIQNILAGDPDLFRKIIERYQRLVSHIVFRMVSNKQDREELCHEVFIKVYQNLSRFQFKAKLSTWIAKITYNLAINYLRKEKIQLYQDLETPEYGNEPNEIEGNLHSELATPDRISEQQDRAKRIEKLINALPEHYKNILTLYHMDEMSYKEISEITTLPEGTVKNYLFRARKLLKEKIVAYYQGELL